MLSTSGRYSVMILLETLASIGFLLPRTCSLIARECCWRFGIDELYSWYAQMRPRALLLSVVSIVTFYLWFRPKQVRWWQMIRVTSLVHQRVGSFSLCYLLPDACLVVIERNNNMKKKRVQDFSVMIQVVTVSVRVFGRGTLGSRFIIVLVMTLRSKVDVLGVRRRCRSFFFNKRYTSRSVSSMRQANPVLHYWNWGEAFFFFFGVHVVHSNQVSRFSNSRTYSRSELIPVFVSFLLFV
jgi:hypothetical protein